MAARPHVRLSLSLYLSSHDWSCRPSALSLVLLSMLSMGRGWLSQQMRVATPHTAVGTHASGSARPVTSCLQVQRRELKLVEVQASSSLNPAGSFQLRAPDASFQRHAP